MSDKSSSSASGGITFTTLLGLLFIGLKLGKVIDWSWLWVLAPFWLGYAVVLGVVLLIGGVALALAFFDSRR
jgi:hypothetical protein